MNGVLHPDDRYRYAVGHRPREAHEGAQERTLAHHDRTMHEPTTEPSAEARLVAVLAPMVALALLLVLVVV